MYSGFPMRINLNNVLPNKAEQVFNINFMLDLTETKGPTLAKHIFNLLPKAPNNSGHVKVIKSKSHVY